MKNKQKMSLPYTFLLAMALTSGSFCYGKDNNVLFSGQLVAVPCVLDDGGEGINVEFDSIVDRYLYLNKRTQSLPFTLHLKDCDISLGKTVRVSFNGRESLALPGLISVDTGNSDAGIAIGLETENGTFLPLGKETSQYYLTKGNNEITFKAYVEAEPDAIARGNITRGQFNAIATFNLEYD